MKKRKFYFRTLVGAGLIAAAAAFPAFADNWIHQENGWVCKTADGYMQTGWYQDKNNGVIVKVRLRGKIKRGKIFPDQRAHEPESVGENVLPAGKDPDDQLL